MATSWYDTGFDDFDNRKEEQDKSRTYQPNRLWMRPEEEREVIFIDDTGFGFWEHQVNIDGNWMNWFTCIKKRSAKGCPICTKGINNYYIMMFTVIDCTPWEDSNGNERNYFRKVLAVKTDTAKGIRRVKQRRGSLIGCKYVFYRAGERSAGCGEIKEFVEEVDLDDPQFEYRNKQGEVIKPVPFEYAKLYEPFEYDDLLVKAKSMGGGRSGRGSSGSRSSKGNSGRGSGRRENKRDDDYEDDIPF